MSKVSMIAVGFFVLAIVAFPVWADDSADRFQPPESLNLKLTAPIRRWDEAIPLGNGLLGGLLWGQDDTIRLSLDRGDLWDLRVRDAFTKADFTWKTIQKLVAEKNQKRLVQWLDAPSDKGLWPTKMPGGRLELTLDPSQRIASFTLDLAHAVGRADLGHGAQLEAFFSASEPVALMYIPGPAPKQWKLIAPAAVKLLDDPEAKTGGDGDTKWFLQEAADGFRYAVVASARRDGTGTLLAVTITTNKEDADPVELGRRRVAEALPVGYGKMLIPHEAWWRKFWSKSRVELPELNHLRQYYLVQYFYGAASRLGSPPMPLQGVWTADNGNLPPWRGDYHNDLNTQTMYIAYQTAGHLDEGRCFLDFLWNLLPQFRAFAKKFYETPGAAVPGVMTIEGKNMGGWAMYSLHPTHAGWLGYLFYQHWRYTMDEAFLRNRAYPWCEEVGQCLLALLKPDADGVLKLPLSASPEIHKNELAAWLKPNSNYDHACMAALFGGLAEMADALNKKDDAAKWRAARAGLGPHAVDPKTQCLMLAPGENLTESHRHLAHTMSIHPFGLLSVEGSDHDRAVIAATCKQYDDLGTQKWCGYSFSWMACLRARLGDAEAALHYLDYYEKAFTHRNGFHRNGDRYLRPLYRSFTLEGNFLAAQAVHEMLLQSWGGVIRVFPATPARWREAAFDDFWAEGGYRVSARRENGVTTWLKVTANHDDLVTIRDNFGGQQPTWNRPTVEKIGDNWLFHIKAGESLEARLARAEPTETIKDTVGNKLQISGIYPHLAVFNDQGECGIGAVVPWAENLWMITYPPHATRGSSDKLYEVDPKLNLTARPESVGGTHACRLIHRESNHLLIGPYVIDAQGNVRTCDLQKLTGRLTAVARHLTDPENKVYFYDMEGTLYEVNVHSRDVTKLFEKPVPGWHGKGAYTAQGRLVVANNGELPIKHKERRYLAGSDPTGSEDAGVLAEWNGKDWRVVERRQFTDVTGPGGIYGSPDDKSPLWSIGWDRRSVILKLLDGGRWYTFRLPKASHCFDPRHGWYTEWPRIREVAPSRLMMDMHGMFYDFPAEFRVGHTASLRPIASHLRYLPDFCQWNGRLVLAGDETSIMQNPMAGTSQSNLWFGQLSDLPTWGPRSGWGGPWSHDRVKAGQASDPFLIGGFDQRIVHLTHDASEEVRFALEVDVAGDGVWRPYQSIAVPARGYRFHIFPRDFAAQWIRIITDKDCTATAYFHDASARDTSQDHREMFASLPKASESAALTAGLIRPAKHNHNLQFVAQRVDRDGHVSGSSYYEVDEAVRFHKVQTDRSSEVLAVASIVKDFDVDDASVIMRRKDSKTGKEFRCRLPKGDSRYDKAFAVGWPRGIRECESERYLMNIHGTFYEMPRDDGLPQIKPICSHGRQIMDFCTWRGLLVLSGNLASMAPNGHFFHADESPVGLWFGCIDDLWRLGKPVGKGGPWRNTPVYANAPSDPYLMTGYDRKQLDLSHDADSDVMFTMEIDIGQGEWVSYRTFTTPVGQTVSYTLPEGFNAHWVRIRADRTCKATATLTYE